MIKKIQLMVANDTDAKRATAMLSVLKQDVDVVSIHMIGKDEKESDTSILAGSRFQNKHTGNVCKVIDQFRNGNKEEMLTTEYSSGARRNWSRKEFSANFQRQK